MPGDSASAESPWQVDGLTMPEDGLVRGCCGRSRSTESSSTSPKFSPSRCRERRLHTATQHNVRQDALEKCIVDSFWLLCQGWLRWKRHFFATEQFGTSAMVAIFTRKLELLGGCRDPPSPALPLTCPSIETLKKTKRK